MTAAITVAFFCGHCGRAIPGTDSREARLPMPADSVHGDCRARLAMEPPRYCAECGRRMKVQVVPGGWSAQCSRHERITE